MTPISTSTAVALTSTARSHQSMSEAGSGSQTQPSSDLPQLLGALTTSTVKPPQTPFNSRFPTVLILQIRSWLSDQESASFLLTSQLMRELVQGVFRKRLRPAVALHCTSPITSYQHSPNRLPEYIPMEQEGELAFQKCMALKESATSETELRSAGLQLVKARLTEGAQIGSISDFTTGVTVALGGQSMADESFDALSLGILALCGQVDPAQMGAMMLGVCNGMGGVAMKAAHARALLRHILASYQTSSAHQMGHLVLGYCTAFVRQGVDVKLLQEVFGQIFASHQTSSAAQMGAMIHSLCLAMRGRYMPAVNREFITRQILSSYTTSSAFQMGDMMGHFCFGLGGVQITPDNFSALVARVLASEGTVSPEQLGLMVFCLHNVVGRADMAKSHRAILVEHIQRSGRTREIVNAIQRVFGGQEILGFLKIDSVTPVPSISP